MWDFDVAQFFRHKWVKSAHNRLFTEYYGNSPTVVSTQIMEEKLRANLGPTRGQPKTDQRQIKDRSKTKQRQSKEEKNARSERRWSATYLGQKPSSVKPYPARKVSIIALR